MHSVIERLHADHANMSSLLDILEREKVDPTAFTYMHACFEPDITYNIEAAKRGVWVEFDSIREETGDKHLKRILTMLDKGFEDQLLLSQDRGWYRGHLELSPDDARFLQEAAAAVATTNRMTCTRSAFPPPTSGKRSA